MNGWRLLGRAILVCVDALAAGLLTGGLAFLAIPWYALGTRIEVAALVCGVVVGVSLAVALALARTGRRPFPATRLAKAGLDRLPWWWP